MVRRGGAGYGAVRLGGVRLGLVRHGRVRTKVRFGKVGRGAWKRNFSNFGYSDILPKMAKLPKLVSGKGILATSDISISSGHFVHLIFYLWKRNFSNFGYSEYEKSGGPNGTPEWKRNFSNFGYSVTKSYRKSKIKSFFEKEKRSEEAVLRVKILQNCTFRKVETKKPLLT